MRLSRCFFAKGFGELAKVRGLITYKISPFEQRAFAGVLKKGIPNTIRRMRDSFWTVVPPFLVSYVIYDQVEREHMKLMRKDPRKYLCEDDAEDDE